MSRYEIVCKRDETYEIIQPDFDGVLYWTGWIFDTKKDAMQFVNYLKETYKLMTDKQTMQDHIEDLIGERNLLLNDIRHLERILEQAFTIMGGHHDNCLMGMMCNCGFMHWHARQDAKK
jgi:hypothetical protein